MSKHQSKKIQKSNESAAITASNLTQRPFTHVADSGQSIQRATEEASEAKQDATSEQATGFDLTNIQLFSTGTTPPPLTINRFLETTPSMQSQQIQRKSVDGKDVPANLKGGIEKLSGMDMSDVQVHYNSDKPAQLQAAAYAQGTDIHIAPGQEQHLAHEAWHVVQQKQGRVLPTAEL